jgi:hypothetical protein
MITLHEKTELNTISGCLYGGVAPLDLLYGHLSTSPYRPAVRHNKPPSDNSLVHESFELCDTGNYRLSIQPFASGGYEVVCNKVDLQSIARLSEIDRKKSIRSPGVEQ